jgi:hypothetical protein
VEPARVERKSYQVFIFSNFKYKVIGEQQWRQVMLKKSSHVKLKLHTPKCLNSYIDIEPGTSEQTETRNKPGISPFQTKIRGFAYWKLIVKTRI